MLCGVRSTVVCVCWAILAYVVAEGWSPVLAEGSPAAPSVISVVADTWCPYNCDDGSRQQGFVVDILREVFAAHGYILKYRTVPWTNALDDVKSGKSDAILGVSLEEARSLVVSRDPIAENQTCFYTRDDDPFRFQTAKSLSTRKIGVTNGYLYGGDLDEYIAKFRTDYSRVQIASGDRPLVLNIRKLLARRVDTIIENKWVMEYSSAKFKITGIRLAGCEAPSPLYLAFSPHRSDVATLVDVLAKGLRQASIKGKLAKSMQNYGISMVGSHQ